MDLTYEADLLGNIQQALAGLQGFDVMALELIQNADDAGAGTLIFDVRKDALVVRNDGRFSTCGLKAKRCPWDHTGDPSGLHRPCNFHAISKVAGRSKVHTSGQIGRFGIGFVSVYQITDTPIIRSAGIEMRLEPVRGMAPTKVVPDTEGTLFELPWAAAQSSTRQALNASPTPKDVEPLILEAIAGVMARGLMFLRHLHSIELRKEGRLEQAVTIRRDNGLVSLEIAPQMRVQRWKVLTRDAGDLAAQRDIFTNYPTLVELDRSPVVQVAIPLSDTPVTGLLYAYLPTEQASGMPLHVNGDFFPHPNRRSIVLSGEQHERYWNELLLDTAAHAIGEAFEALRDFLGGSRLWALGSAAFALKDAKGFSGFWKAFSEAAKSSPSVWTAGRTWHRPAECYLAPEQLSGAEQTAVTSIGLHLLHSDLRPMWTVLSSVGATQLRLSTLVAALQARGENPVISLGDPHLPALWSAVSVMLEISRSLSGFADVLKKLKTVTFLLNADGEPTSIDQIWRAPQGVHAAMIRRYVPDCPLVHPEVTHCTAIMEAINAYGLDDLAKHLSGTITSEFAAANVIGTDASSVRDFYDLLTGFDTGSMALKTGAILASVPMLRTASGFVSPSRGQLPGRFVDPIGHFELIDTVPISERMQYFARAILGVRVLTFKDYLENHLEDILASNPTREQYALLLGEIADHMTELDAEGGLQPLSEQAFVRTRAGTYVRPEDCYYWSSALEALVGDDGTHWVDEDWMPSSRSAYRFRDLLESRLGMRSTVSTKDIVARITEIAESPDTGGIDEIASLTAPILRHVLDHYPRFGPEDLGILERLRAVAFLPGAMNGERIQGTRYPPGLVYRAFRASGFSSQVPVVDLPPLRGGGGAGPSLTEFLNLLQMPPEPPTEKIVAHLEHCIAQDLPVSDLTYAILSERLDKDDADCIDRLSSRKFIYDAEAKRYLPADRVFWLPPPFGGHWHAASQRMRLREPLYRGLGVGDAPGPAHYASLLSEIASQEHPSDEDRAVHARCLSWLAEALDRGTDQAEEAIEGLAGKPAFLSLHGIPIQTEEAAWVDSELLAAPFGGTLNDWLVAPPAIHRSAAARLFRHMNVISFSEIACLRLTSFPGERPAPEATARLHERADLLLWLLPAQEFRHALSSILDRIEVRFTTSLHVQAEITRFDPPVRSPADPASAYFDPQTAMLYVRAADGEATDWSAIFRALFAQLESHAYTIDMSPVIMTAAYVTSLPTWKNAEQALRNANYQPPEETIDLPQGAALSDIPSEAVDEAGLDEQTSEATRPGGTASPDGPDRQGNADDTDEPDEEEDGEQGDRSDNTIPESRATARTMPTGSSQDPPPFKSRPLGADLRIPASGLPTKGSGRHGTDSGGLPGSSGIPVTGRGSRTRGAATVPQTRRSRMLTYVSTGQNHSEAANRDGDDNNVSGEIDRAAVAAALKYEQARGWVAEEQLHGNPGYDIISRAAESTARRLIEVKGLAGEWTPRGIKLSHVQYGMAERHPDEFWIYIVENAPDLQRQRVSAIANPFSKVEEYWFDSGWKGISEEIATAEVLNIRVGARVSHSLWKTGVITAVERRGIAWMLTIDFGPLEGRRYIPYNSGLSFVD
ncbi:MAG: DUF3883 domain-containing protein [Pseudomonadota bacterium]